MIRIVRPDPSSDVHVVFDGHDIVSSHDTEPEARRAAGLFAEAVADRRTGPTLSAHLRRSAEQSGRFFAGPNGIFPHRNRGAADYTRSRFNQLAAQTY